MTGAEAEALLGRLGVAEERVGAIESRVTQVEGRLGIVETRQSRTEKILMEIQGEVRSGQKAVLSKLDEVKELLSMGLGKTIVKAVTTLTRNPDESTDEFQQRVDALDKKKE